VNSARRLLVLGGLLLAAFGMLYGLHYAIFVEHQALDRMGGSLTRAFVRAAERNTADAHAAVDQYASTRYDYVRQVDVHSHWIGLAMLLIVLGAVFDKVTFSERARMWIASALVAGSFAFPFGVILQTASHGASYASALAILGTAAVTIGLAAIAWGFAR
jgi:hypothetical protein